MIATRQADPAACLVVASLCRRRFSLGWSSIFVRTRSLVSVPGAGAERKTARRERCVC